jgi:hypothetical protein
MTMKLGMLKAIMMTAKEKKWKTWNRNRFGIKAGCVHSLFGFFPSSLPMTKPSPSPPPLLSCPGRFLPERLLPSLAKLLFLSV